MKLFYVHYLEVVLCTSAITKNYRNKSCIALYYPIQLFKSVPKDFGPKAQNLKGKDLLKDLWYGNYFIEK